jgi:hypothetical protein
MFPPASPAESEPAMLPEVSGEYRRTGAADLKNTIFKVTPTANNIKTAHPSTERPRTVPSFRMLVLRNLFNEHKAVIGMVYEEQ